MGSLGKTGSSNFSQIWQHHLQLPWLVLLQPRNHNQYINKIKVPRTVIRWVHITSSTTTISGATSKPHCARTLSSSEQLQQSWTGRGSPYCLLKSSSSRMFKGHIQTSPKDKGCACVYKQYTWCHILLSWANNSPPCSLNQPCPSRVKKNCGRWQP